MNIEALRGLKGTLAAGLCLVSMLAGSAYAASGDGSLVGKVTAGGDTPGEVEITVRNPDTGFTRTVQVNEDGTYRFPFLPVGRYELSAQQGDTSLGKITEVTVSLGASTTADVDLNAPTLGTVNVIGSRVVYAVDVRSTESATNVTRAELDRLPVERDVLAVALLAPGNAKGDAGLCAGGNCGVSFGGSSIAENTVYINGLNVTDFYNRVGASSVPYAFYKEFQVKTGGYSVEFGRTTGGVINAVTRSGTNEFEFGTEAVWEPEFLQSSASNRPGRIAKYDDYDNTEVNFYASGPIVKDRLFFFALYEMRDYQPRHTNDAGLRYFDAKQDNGFWGTKIDWQISDKHLLELLAFSDDNDEVEDIYDFDFTTGDRGAWQNTQFTQNGGDNYSATYTAYLTDTFSVKGLYGANERSFATVSLNDIDCTRYRDRRPGGAGDTGCTTSTSVTDRLDEREAARLDFEWTLGDHLLRFGLDREQNTSNHSSFYPGPERLTYEIFATSPGATLENGGVVPAGVDAYVRTRKNEVDGKFKTINEAYYLEDNWSVTPNLVLNAGLRLEAFDNRNSDGDSYIKIDDMLAPRFGFSWDMKGDSRTKIFGNLGRYYLPVANVINIKQAGGFFDERTFYVFQGFEDFEYNGQTYQRPILGAQIGTVDNSQGDGTVGDLRGEVDADMDPVYQDELILGYQTMINDRWSWGVRGIYRKLHNAIDDMEITSNGILCGGVPGEVGFVMGNPGEDLTVFTDTDCDGENDGFVTIDTSQAGWALYDENDNYLGERGYSTPKRDYKALEFVVDRAWDNRWSMNASYTLSWTRGNAEGPVNSDTNFADAGRTEVFDNPWVNLGGYGYLANDRRHQFKLRGVYGIGESWQVGMTLNAQSGGPINAFGVGNPFDGTNFRSFFVCVANCDSPVFSERQYEHHGRASGGRLPWTFDLGANVTYTRSFSAADLLVKFSVNNLLNQERVLEVDDVLEDDINHINPDYQRGTNFQSPRYALLQVKLEF